MRPWLVRPFDTRSARGTLWVQDAHSPDFDVVAMYLTALHLRMKMLAFSAQPYQLCEAQSWEEAAGLSVRRAIAPLLSFYLPRRLWLREPAILRVHLPGAGARLRAAADTGQVLLGQGLRRVEFALQVFTL